MSAGLRRPTLEIGIVQLFRRRLEFGDLGQAALSGFGYEFLVTGVVFVALVVSL